MRKCWLWSKEKREKEEGRVRVVKNVYESGWAAIRGVGVYDDECVCGWWYNSERRLLRNLLFILTVHHCVPFPSRSTTITIERKL